MRNSAGAVLVCLVILGLLTSQSVAQNVKIGFITTLEVLNTTEEGKIEIDRLNQFRAQKRQELETNAGELQQLQEQYATQQRTLNLITRTDMERNIQEKERTLKRDQEDVQLEYQQKADELLARMSAKIQEIINDYAPGNGFSAIFLRDQSQIYVAPAIDITQEVIRLYNEKYPVTVVQ